jgi:hypothetical protein
MSRGLPAGARHRNPGQELRPVTPSVGLLCSPESRGCGSSTPRPSTPRLRRYAQADRNGLRTCDRLLAFALSLLAASLLGACDFDRAYERYCEGNPACGEQADGGTGQDAGRESKPLKSCERPEECAPDTEICHPLGHVCVPVCETDDDCPPDQKTCALVYDDFGMPAPVKACTCTSAQSCSIANPANTCSPVDNICETMCAGDDDCAAFQPARFCDEASGLCLVSPSTCSSSSDCVSPSLPRCDLSIQRCVGCLSPNDCAGRTDGLTECEPRHGTCVAPRTCDPAQLEPGIEGGPDVCRYGQWCPEGVCIRIEPGSCWGAVNLQWDPHQGGPVITSASGSASSTSTFSQCPDGGWHLTATIDFYAPDGLFFPDYGALRRGVVFQNPTGAGPEGGRSEASFVESAPPSGSQYGRIVAGLCGRSDFSGWSVQLVDDLGTGGNVVCLQ